MIDLERLGRGDRVEVLRTFKDCPPILCTGTVEEIDNVLRAVKVVFSEDSKPWLVAEKIERRVGP